MPSRTDHKPKDARTLTTCLADFKATYVFEPSRPALVDKCPVCAGAGWLADCSRGPTDVRLVRCNASHCSARSEMDRTKLETLFGQAHIPELFADAKLATVDQPLDLRIQIEKGMASGKNLLFRGKAGVGKTYYASALLRAELGRGRAARFCVVPDLLDRIRLEYNQPGHGAGLFEVIEMADFLVLDDLGTEKLTEWVGEKLYQLVNSRVVNVRQTLYTTNLTPGELTDRFGERLASRIGGSTEVVKFSGPDRRLRARE